MEINVCNEHNTIIKNLLPLFQNFSSYVQGFNKILKKNPLVFYSKEEKRIIVLKSKNKRTIYTFLIFNSHMCV